MGFAAERLHAEHPTLICCSISGFGDEGPMANRKAYDLLIQAETGLASITGAPEAPGRVGISIVDIGTGTMAHAAILEALIARSITGKGADIRVSMFDAMADWLTVPVMYAQAGKPPKRVGLGHATISPYGVFASADGRDMLIAVQSDREWRSLCRNVLGRPEIAETALRNQFGAGEHPRRDGRHRRADRGDIGERGLGGAPERGRHRLRRG